MSDRATPGSLHPGNDQVLTLSGSALVSAGIQPGDLLAGTEGVESLKNRGRFYHYLRQNGLWTKEVTGFDHAKDRARLDHFCPVRNVTPEYPPTLLIHGTEDTDVPYQLSVDMEKEFTRHKVPHELVTVPGAGHGLARGDKKLIDAAYEKSLDFIREKLKAK